MRGTQQPQFQALYRACIKDAAVQGAELMRSTLARALRELPQAAAALGDVVERGLLHEALDVLRERQHTLVEDFPQALLTEFAHAIAGDRGSPLSFESLALLGDEQLQDNADLVRACGALEQAVRPQLLELEHTLAAAFRQCNKYRNVEPDRCRRRRHSWRFVTGARIRAPGKHVIFAIDAHWKSAAAIAIVQVIRVAPCRFLRLLQTIVIALGPKFTRKKIGEFFLALCMPSGGEPSWM